MATTKVDWVFQIKERPVFVPTAFTGAAIQTALTAANVAGGGLVELLNGTYTITGKLAISSNVTLRGQGVGSILQVATNAWPSNGGAAASPFWYANSVSNLLCVIGGADGASNITLRDFVLDMNGANQAQTGTGADILFINCSYVSVTGVTVKNAKHLGTAMEDLGTANSDIQYIQNIIHGFGSAPATGGIFSQAVGGVMVRNKSDGLGDASFIYNGAPDGLIEGNEDIRGTVGISTASISVEGCKSCKVLNNLVEGPCNAGHYFIDEIGSQTAVTDVVVSGNTSRSNAAGSPVFSLVLSCDGNHPVKRIRVADNDFSGASSNLIAMTKASEVLIHDNNLTASGNDAIFVNTGCSKIKIHDNEMTGNTGYAIDVGATANTSIVIQNNEIFGNGSGDINDASLAAIISGNHTDSTWNGISSFSTIAGQTFTLVNGANQNVVTTIGVTNPASIYFSIAGPSAGFNIGGFANHFSFKTIYLINSTGQALTLNNNDAGSTAGNRINTLTGGNLANVVRATLIYDPSAVAWVVQQWQTT